MHTDMKNRIVLNLTNCSNSKKIIDEIKKENITHTLFCSIGTSEKYMSIELENRHSKNDFESISNQLRSLTGIDFSSIPISVYDKKFINKVTDFPKLEYTGKPLCIEKIDLTVNLLTRFNKLPESENLWQTISLNIPQREMAIENLARVGDVVLISGASKAGKSQLCIELSIAFASGEKWLEFFKCKQCKVLYLNTEIDRNDFASRFKATINALNLIEKEEAIAKEIDAIHLRGNSYTLEELSDEIIDRISKNNYGAVIIDPIYKLQSGDENDLRAVDEFMSICSKIAEQTKTIVILTHHHSKGAKNTYSTVDRMCGSGGFARSCDSIIDFIEAKSGKDKGYNYFLNTKLRGFESLNDIRIQYSFPLHKIVITNEKGDK